MGRKLMLIFATLTMIVAGGALYFSLTQGQAAATESQTVYVAVGDLAPGTSGSSLTEQQVEPVQVAASVVPPNALASLAAVANLQMSVPVFKGQILMARQFAVNSSTGGLPIPADQNAVSVQFSDPARVAGFVQPGSKVAVYQISDGTANVLLPSAAVIAVGPTTGQAKSPNASSNVGIPATIVTFALTPTDAAKVVGAAAGSLYLGLLPN